MALFPASNYDSLPCANALHIPLCKSCVEVKTAFRNRHVLLSPTCRNDAQGFVVFHVSALSLFACISCSLAKTNLRGGRSCYLPARSIWLGRLPSSVASGMNKKACDRQNFRPHSDF